MDFEEKLKQIIKENQDKEFDKMFTIAMDEMDSEQYEDAKAHFNRAYEINPDFYITSYLRAYCDSHLGTRGNVVPDFQTLTSAFLKNMNKALEESDRNTRSIYVGIISITFVDGVSLLKQNAVDFSDSSAISGVYRKTFDNMISDIASCDIDEKVDLIKNLVKKSFIGTYYPGTMSGGFYPVYLREAYDKGLLEKNDLNALCDFFIEHAKATKSGLMLGFGSVIKKIEKLKA